MSLYFLNTKAWVDIFGKKIHKRTFLRCEVRNESYEIRIF